MTSIVSGNLIRDNDPRCPGRVLEVLEVRVKPGLVTLVKAAVPPDHRRPVILRLDRIHTDGKTRRSGFSLVTDQIEK